MDMIDTIEKMEMALLEALALVDSYKQETVWRKRRYLLDEIDALINGITDTCGEILEAPLYDANIEIEQRNGTFETASAAARRLKNEAAAIRIDLAQFLDKTQKPMSNDYDYTKAERQARFRAKKKALEQRRCYAAKRASLACDRVIQATSSKEKDQAAKWAKAWTHFSYYKS
jgi:hypothetical protein